MSDDKKKLDGSITTLENLLHATSSLRHDLQMYIQHVGYDVDETLAEITEVQLILPKTQDDVPYLVLRCR